MPKIVACGALRLRAEPGPTFHANENLASGVLAAGCRIEGLPCAGGEEVEFHADGRLAGAVLAADWTVNGLPARGGAPVAFYADGALRFVTLAQPRRIHGFPAAPGNLFLHPDGRVWSGKTAAAATLGRVLVPAGTRITMDAGGQPLEFWRTLEVDTEIQGIPCSARFPAWFYPDGRLSCAHLSRPHRLEGRRYPAETELVMDGDGAVLSAYARRYPRAGAVPWRIFGAIDEPLIG